MCAHELAGGSVRYVVEWCGWYGEGRGLDVLSDNNLSRLEASRAIPFN